MLAVCHDQPHPAPLFQTTLYHVMNLSTFAPIPERPPSSFFPRLTLDSKRRRNVSKTGTNQILYFLKATLKLQNPGFLTSQKYYFLSFLTK